MRYWKAKRLCIMFFVLMWHTVDGCFYVITAGLPAVAKYQYQLLMRIATDTVLRETVSVLNNLCPDNGTALFRSKELSGSSQSSSNGEITYVRYNPQRQPSGSAVSSTYMKLYFPVGVSLHFSSLVSKTQCQYVWVFIFTDFLQSIQDLNNS